MLASVCQGVQLRHRAKSKTFFCQKSLLDCPLRRGMSGQHPTSSTPALLVRRSEDDNHPFSSRSRPHTGPFEKMVANVKGDDRYGYRSQAK